MPTTTGLAKPVLVRVLDDPLAPEISVDAVIGGYLKNGTVRLTFISRRCDYSKQPPEFADVVVARLTMPTAAAKDLQQFLGRFAEHMHEQLITSGELAIKVLQ